MLLLRVTKPGSRRLLKSEYGLQIAPSLQVTGRRYISATRGDMFSCGRLTLERLVEVDDFIAELWKVHLAVKKEGVFQVH